MIDNDGFTVTLEESGISFLKDSVILKVTKTIVYRELQVVPKELLENSKFLNSLISSMREHIREKITNGTKEKES
jgi:hypothetical protein